MGGTVSWGNIYGPSGGYAVSQQASQSTNPVSGIADRLPLQLPVIALICLAAWWALEKWD